MPADRPHLQPLNEVLAECDAATKKHEHRTFMGVGEVALRQEVDRARPREFDFVVELLDQQPPA